jgi:hypothetical protein
VRRVLPFLALCGLMVGVVSTLVAQPPKDTPLAEKTRNVKLKTKISMDIKNEMLRDVMKEISGALEEKKVGSLSVQQGNGVSMNARVSVMCKDKPVEEILDELFKPLNLGYYVVSKAGDRYDGFLHINTSPNDRGHKGDEMAKDGKKETKEEKKDDPKKKEEVKKKDDPKKKDENKDEAAAASKLNLIKSYIDSKKTEQAVAKIEELLKMYPNTKAAEEAKGLLEKLKK